jgi:hypothetical protein
MDVPVELIRRTKGRADVEDLALTFKEEELGRFDWNNNWQKIKADGTARGRIGRWLEALQIDASPEDIMAYLDRTAAERPGQWL